MLKRIALLMFVSLVPIFAINAPAADEFSPVVVSSLTAGATPFTGTDGKIHVVYELVFTNANATPATLQKVEVLDASDPCQSAGIVRRAGVADALACSQQRVRGECRA